MSRFLTAVSGISALTGVGVSDACLVAPTLCAPAGSRPVPVQGQVMAAGDILAMSTVE